MHTIMAGIIGLLLGLAYCYWKQAQTLYNNRGVIGAAGTLIGDAQDLWQKL